MLQAFSGAPGVFDDLETVPKGNLLLKIFFLYDTVVTRFPVQLILGTYNMAYELEAVLDEYTVL